MDNGNDRDEPRRRTLSEATTAAREAGRLVRDINDRIGRWQAESVRLATTAERLRRSGRSDPGLVEAIDVLAALVEGQRRNFAATLQTLPGSVVQHSRVRDTERALRMVLERLQAARGETGTAATALRAQQGAADGWHTTQGRNGDPAARPPIVGAGGSAGGTRHGVLDAGGGEPGGAGADAGSQRPAAEARRDGGAGEEAIEPPPRLC
ncbi:MAG: hypothetical protein BGO82_15145 [Devosia sp. 67-54]|nr:MAG: hypothetical protein BGO82_15145 [Devosia sp. 67-54]